MGSSLTGYEFGPRFGLVSQTSHRVSPDPLPPPANTPRFTSPLVRFTFCPLQLVGLRYAGSWVLWFPASPFCLAPSCWSCFSSFPRSCFQDATV
ncbi:hypothetical protein HanPSC8_Chr09g0355431 [Helianthus annuus]|nr:hypothetical protein HanPSC8_Chr09g0355431 [Helianthus annuus]